MEADYELACLTSLLGLDEFEVVESRWDRPNKFRQMTLVPKIDIGLCPNCHHCSDRRHVCHDRVITDLPMGDQRMELVVRLWQFECSTCGQFFTPRYAGLAEGAHATERLLEKLAELISHGDIANAARFFSIPEKTAEGWYYGYLKRKAKESPRPLQPVRSLGIDELSLKKSTDNFAAF
jgi:transposase